MPNCSHLSVRKKGYLKDVEFLIKLGKHIRKIRKSKGFTQEKLALEIDVDISQISRIERGILNTSVSTMKAISRALDVNVKDLFDF